MKSMYRRCITAPLLITFAASVLSAGEPPRPAVDAETGGDPSSPAGTAVFTSKTSTVTRAVAAASEMTPLESSLGLWRKGDKNGAVEKFLQIDWTKSKTPFHKGSPLSTREQDLAKMSAKDRESLMREVDASLNDLKQLATAARDKALATTDKTVSKGYLAKPDECGVALDQPDAMLIVKLTARSIRKLALADVGAPAR